MSTAPFQCPCCGNETAVAGSIEEGAARFSGVTRDLIEALSSGRWMARDALYSVLYGHRADGEPSSLTVISARICQVRKQLAPFGDTIESAARGGSRNGAVYRVAPADQTVAS